MHETATLALAIWAAILTWTVSVISGSVWLNSKFRHMEKTIYREGEKHNKNLTSLAIRVQRLELKLFGFTPVVFEDTDKSKSEA